MGREEGITRKEKNSGSGLGKGGKEQERVRSEKACWIEGTGNECLGRGGLAEGEGS